MSVGILGLLENHVSIVFGSKRGVDGLHRSGECQGQREKDDCEGSCFELHLDDLQNLEVIVLIVFDVWVLWMLTREIKTSC